ncbi:hypothetical protein C806_01229 [Lachnospiraceae bacterium 3-1]|nr:hypothetical protein C806_01229 [Lachnospiraceae bacterium 3-1]
MTELEINKEYTYPQICEIVGWEQKAGNSKKAQLREIEDAYEYYHPENKKTHKPKKSYIFTRKIRDLVEPSKENSAGNNRKNIQSMIWYLQAKFDLDDNWYSFTDWYCEKLELMHKGICNAVYHPDEVDAVCEKYNISDGKLFCEYVSAAKSELKNMFLKALAYLDKKNKITYQDQYKFTYQLGKRTKGNVITDSLNERIEENETIVCNDMNEDYKLSKKMKGRQLLKTIYSKEKLTKEFKELSLGMLQDDEYAINKLNCELSYQHPTFHPDYCSICKERPLISYYRGIAIAEMELEESDQDCLALDITNRIRTKVRKSLMKSYRKPMEQSDLQAIEKALFQQYYDKIDEDIILLADNDDASDIEQIFGETNKFTDKSDNWGEPVSMENDFIVEEILDMPTEGEVQMNLTNTNCVGQDELCKNESHGRKTDRELFCVTRKDSDLLDLDDLY